MLTFRKIALVLISVTVIVTLEACGGGTNVTTNGGTSSSGAELVSISISPTDPTIALGTSQDFTATGIYADNSTQDLTSEATWDSSDITRAVILAPGRIRGTVVGKINVSARWGHIKGETTLTVTPAQLVSIEITPANASVARGTTQQYAATGVFSDSTTQDITQSVTWSSSSVSIASISNSNGSYGLATSASAGITTITATLDSVSASTTLTVTSAVLVSLSVTPTNQSIALGTTRQFAAVGTYSDNSTQDITSVVTWNSGNTGVATISNSTGSKGLATSTGTGSTSITALSGAISGSTSLTVTAATLTAIAVSPVNPSIALGTSRQFTATGTYSNGTTQDVTSAVTWSSSATNIATISNAAGTRGLAASVATGSTTISAILGSVSGSTTLIVTTATLSSIAVTPSNPSIASGTTRQFTATGTYSNGSTQDLTASVTWSSTNTGVASISNTAGSKGLSTGVAAGSTTIRATSGSISGSTTLTVTAATLTSITISPLNRSLTIGGTQQYTATGTYSNGSTQDLTAVVTWSSSDSSVASISNATGSKGLASATAAGSTTIAAVSGGVSSSTLLSVSAAGGDTLAWDAPTSNTDNTVISDLAGYKIYFGSSSGQYPNYVDVGNVTSFSIAALSALVPTHGTYFLVVTAYDSSGNESGYSNEISAAL